MLEVGKAAHYFLCVNSPQGYQSYLSNLYNPKLGWKTLILIGGPEERLTGILEKTGNALVSAGEDIELIHSCFDPGRLDAVSIPRLRACLIDGNPPNHMESTLPGLSESMVNLSDCLNEEILSKYRENIYLFAAREESSRERAFHFLSAAASLQSDTSRLALECTNFNKIDSYALHVARQKFPQTGRPGCESQRFLEAITAGGQLNLFDYIFNSFAHIYEIDDEYGIGKLFISKLRNEALANGYDIVSCSSPMFPDGKPMHLLIPSLSTAFLTIGRNYAVPAQGIRHIHVRRFLDMDAFALKRSRISFNRKASRELINEAITLLDDAHANRQMINSYYEKALKKEEAAKKAEEISARLLSYAKIR